MKTNQTNPADIATFSPESVSPNNSTLQPRDGTLRSFLRLLGLSLLPAFLLIFGQAASRAQESVGVPNLSGTWIAGNDSIGYQTVTVFQQGKSLAFYFGNTRYNGSVSDLANDNRWHVEYLNERRESHNFMVNIDGSITDYNTGMNWRRR